MTVTNDLEGRVDAPAPLEMPCPTCGGEGQREFFLPRGWRTVHDRLVTANEVREANSSARLREDRLRLERAWRAMRVAWKIAEQIGIVQDIGAYWCGMAKSGFNNVVCGRVGDRRLITPAVVPEGIKLRGEPKQISIPCARCGGSGVLKFQLSPAQAEVVGQLTLLGENPKYGDPERHDQVRELAKKGSNLGLTQELMAFALNMSRAGLIGILKAGRS
jgi:hypothetical protein